MNRNSGALIFPTGLPLARCQRDAGVLAGRRRGPAAEEQGVGREDDCSDGLRPGEELEPSTVRSWVALKSNLLNGILTPSSK